MILRSRIDAPIGPMTLYSDGDRLLRVVLPGSDMQQEEEALGAPIRDGADGIIQAAARQIAEYFAGARRDFEVPLHGGGTAFQRAVWSALRDIPYGETRSYADIAAAVGRPGAARAVGQANRRNPLPVLVPCHRVVAADGSLGGYQGGRSEEGGMKAALLEHERRRPA